MTLTNSQIVAICLLGVGVLLAIAFTIAFIVECCLDREPKPAKQKKAEKTEEKEEISEVDLDQMLAQLEAASKKEPEPKPEPEPEPEPVKEEVKEEPKQEPKQEKQEGNTTIIINNISSDKGPEFDYRVRLEKIKESQAKLEKDLEKTTRAITKYERTIRRKERNQKMLDRRALELTNLNLLMYSVTDIKNVDAEKKARQEELTAHIAELKASIQDAENYIEANKEKHENNLKLREYLTREKKRYADEVKELEDLIKAGKFFDDKK